jgi:hypothetical protein
LGFGGLEAKNAMQCVQDEEKTDFMTNRENQIRSPHDDDATAVVAVCAIITAMAIGIAIGFCNWEVERMKHIVNSVWIQAEAIELCRKIEAVCPRFGCHVALTGGLLYKEGQRKDCDILFYRIRQRETIDTDGLKVALESIGMADWDGFGWCVKATYRGKTIDIFFPEEDTGPEYLSEGQCE